MAACCTSMAKRSRGTKCQSRRWMIRCVGLSAWTATSTLQTPGSCRRYLSRCREVLQPSRGFRPVRGGRFIEFSLLLLDQLFQLAQAGFNHAVVARLRVSLGPVRSKDDQADDGQSAAPAMTILGFGMSGSPTKKDWQTLWVSGSVSWEPRRTMSRPCSSANRLSAGMSELLRSDRGKSGLPKNIFLASQGQPLLIQRGENLLEGGGLVVRNAIQDLSAVPGRDMMC